MKRFLLLLTLCGLLSVAPAQAQKVEEALPTQEFYKHSWKDNWYLQLSAGAQHPLFSSYNRIDKDKISALYGASLGHWVTPKWGFRLRGQGGPLHYNYSENWKKIKYMNLGLEFTWDLLNTVSGVNDNRVFSLIPYLGVGGTYAWGYEPYCAPSAFDGYPRTKQLALNASVGFEFRFRCSKHVDLFVDVRGTAIGDNLDNRQWKPGFDPILSASGGISINFGKDGRHSTKYVPKDYSGQIDELNNNINSLRGELADKESQLRAKEAELQAEKQRVAEPAPVDQAPVVIPAIRFKFDSYSISANDKITIYDVAEVLKANEDATVTIKGYADKNTGSAEYNKRLSENRAEAVKKALVSYGIDESRISTEGVGVSNQPYSNNKWNRVALISIK